MLKRGRDSMKLFETIINMKINRIQADELLSIAGQYGIELNRKQAEQICSVLIGKNINIFEEQQRKQVVAKIAQIAGTDTANKIESIFLQLTGIK
jgi:ribosomal protein L12E/L44/L45/RPP1/RPP2